MLATGAIASASLFRAQPTSATIHGVDCSSLAGRAPEVGLAAAFPRFAEGQHASQVWSHSVMIIGPTLRPDLLG